MRSVAEVAGAVAAAARRIDDAQVAHLTALLVAAPRVFVLGAGRSGLMARAAANRWMHLGLVVHVVGEVTTPAIGPGDLLVAVSRSGRTTGVVTGARVARDVEARVVAMTADPTGELARLAHAMVVVPTAQESDQRLGSGFEQLVLLTFDTVGAELAVRSGQSDDDLAARHANLE